MNINKSEELAKNIFMANLEYVRRIARLNAPSPDLVEDVVNECYLLFMEGRDKWQLTLPGIRDLLGVLTRQSAFRLRHKNRGMTQELAQKIYNALLARTSRLTSETHEREKSCLPKAIAKLPLRHQVILQLYYYEEKTVREIAGLLKMKEENLCRTLSRLRGRLRLIIEKMKD